MHNITANSVNYYYSCYRSFTILYSRSNIRLDMRNSCLITIVCSLYLFTLVLSDRCCQINDRESPVYKLAKEKSRSTISVTARKQTESLDKCREFAVSKKALAFNYKEASTRDLRRRSRWKDSNCQALECSEINGFSGLVNDTRFGYYSIYRSQKSPANGTVRCLPRVGVFYISEDHLNYTNAQSACKKLRGTLAHVVSEERTEGLGKFIKDVPTFVGLSNRDKERLWKNEFDEPLQCFDYRGWAIKEPAHSRGCVVLLSPENRRTSSSWRVSPCSRKFPYICEILPRSLRRSREKVTKN